ncbi:uncharacterized protein LOC130826607 [Amaranthus tricolor]|uniref:uncharacterized protein LOC130826607 n=1 Tax=Amaranthus tricolor TaxID=29722 RepID=UPI002584F376|nr:uncharacterized protein LOC130826607 [Amaranthus tricolor]
MEEVGYDSALPWSWVVEALAKSQLVDTTLLYELLSKVPPLLGDSGKQARETAALRCLEGRFGPNLSNEYHVEFDESDVAFDPAESCEAALQRITSGSECTSDEVKWDIQSFINHKKASLPISTLELLKDTILEGIHPVAASLKENFGVDFLDKCLLNLPCDGNDPTSALLRSIEDDYGGKTMPAEENGCLPESNIANQVVQAYLPNGHLLPCSGGISNRCTDHVQEIDAASLEMDNHRPPVKKRRMECGVQSMKQHSVPVASNQMSHGAEDEHCSEDKKGVNDGKSCGKYDEQAKTHVENHDQQPISPNIGDRCYEEIDLAMKSPNFLSSQSAFTRDFLAMTETQPNICMKCNKDGQLLSCSGVSCSLMFHENCLGCSAYFDDQGLFYCPFCAYSRAISEYVRAKEKVSLTRKELSRFIGGRALDRQQHEQKESYKA